MTFACVLSHVRLFVTAQTTAHQAPPSVGFLRKEFWSGMPFPSAGDLLDSGLEPVPPVSTALADGFFTTESTGKPVIIITRS